MQEDIINYFLSRKRKYGQQYGLEHISFLLSYFGNIHQSLRVIHISGTNGKGSVVSFLSSIISKSGVKVGSFSSPFYRTISDMYKINCRELPLPKFYKYFNEVRQAVEVIEKSNDIYFTEFEIEVALAFFIFHRERCEIVVMETGCGGLLDATNIITKPLISVLTSIDYDHIDLLGHTLEEIAYHKCGIIKQGCDAITLSTNDIVVISKIKEECAKKHAHIHIANIDEITRVKYSSHSQYFIYGKQKYAMKMLGKYQIDNAFLAVKVCEILTSRGILDISKKNIKKGLLSAYNEGRFEIIHHGITFILDGAHNVGAAIKLKQSLKTFYRSRKYIFVFGMFRDKQAEEFIKILLGDAFKIFLTPLPDTCRSLTTAELFKIVFKFNERVYECADVDEAIRRARDSAIRGAIVIVCGSISFLHLAHKAIKSIKCLCGDAAH